MFFWLLLLILVTVFGLLSVAFLTLLERKLLGLSQSRLGPNKISLLGVLQPVFDGVKLIFKEFFNITMSQTFFSIMPSLLFFCFLLMWNLVLPWMGDFFLFKFKTLVYFSILGVSAYSIILTGWSAMSSYSKMGSMRGILQSLSFEVALIFTFFLFIIFSKSFLLNISNSNKMFELFFYSLLPWFLISMMETNRAPFDLLEGESELISGFNIEMGSIPFVFLFLSEYGMIIFMTVLISVFFFSYISMMFSFFFVFLLFMRSCFPRIRYDFLMQLMWKSMLPISILLLNLFYMFSFYSMNNFL